MGAHVHTSYANMVFKIKMMHKINGINWPKLRLQAMHCPVCASIRPIVKLNDNEIMVRCLYCRSSAVTMSIVAVLRHIVPDLEKKIIYELSARGALFRYLSRHSRQLFVSEFFEDVSPGAFLNGVQCQDVQHLTYPSESFDVCTATEVFEHVPDDLKGFSEIRRVLKPGGVFVFTVPLGGFDETIERARITPAGNVRHLLPPEYHRDPIRSHRPVLSFRDYGRDIVDRMKSQGFSRAEIVAPRGEIPWGFKRFIVVGYRSGS